MEHAPETPAPDPADPADPLTDAPDTPDTQGAGTRSDRRRRPVLMAAFGLVVLAGLGLGALLMLRDGTDSARPDIRTGETQGRVSGPDPTVTSVAPTTLPTTTTAPDATAPDATAPGPTNQVPAGPASPAGSGQTTSPTPEPVPTAPAPPPAPPEPVRVVGHRWGATGMYGAIGSDYAQAGCRLDYSLVLSDGTTVSRTRTFPFAGLSDGNHSQPINTDAEYGAFPGFTYNYTFETYVRAPDGTRILRLYIC